MKKNILFTFFACIMICSCSSRSNIVTIPVPKGQTGDQYGGPVTLPEPAPGRLIGQVPKQALPKASVFKMSGDYSNNVAVTLGPDGNLTYFPAPTDLTPNSVPMSLGDGWYLNRQGIGPNSVFTKWTFDEYRSLPQVPSPAEIKAAVIPGARVTSFESLTITPSQASAMSPDELLKLIEQ